eukprot:g2529.t3
MSRRPLLFVGLVAALLTLQTGFLGQFRPLGSRRRSGWRSVSPLAKTRRFAEEEESAELSEMAKANIEKLSEEIKDLNDVIEEKKGAHSRLKLEIDNFRQRTRSELAVARGKAAIPLVQELLPIADEYEYAKQNLKVETDGQKAVVAKFEALFEKMLQSWKSLGIEKMASVGEEFNPELHEAAVLCTVIALEPIIASSAKVPPEEKKQARPAVGTAKADVGDSADTDMDTSTWVESEDSDLKELFGHNGVKLTAGIIVADVVGAGILAMPVVQGSGSSD